MVCEANSNRLFTIVIILIKEKRNNQSALTHRQDTTAL